MADALAKELDGIDRTRKAFAARIKELNNKRCKDVDDFQRTLNELVRLKIQDEALGTVRGIVITTYKKIVERTPVKTGRAEASWQFSTSAPSDYVPPPGNYKSAFECPEDSSGNTPGKSGYVVCALISGYIKR